MPETIRPIRRTSPIGLIGLGLMGHALAERLIAACYTVSGWDISPDARAAFAKLGGQPAAGNADVFTRCNRVLLSLPDDRVVSAVLRDAGSSLRRGHVIIDSSTGSPEPAEALGRRLQSRRVTYLDATISGSSAQVLRGEVLVMVGGAKTAFARCRDLFQTFAKDTIHTGPCGSGARMKLVTNLVLGLNRAALAEGLVFARLLGLDGEKALHVLRQSMAYSRMMDTKGEKMLQGDFTPQAKLSQHLKDVRLMLAAAKKSGATLPLSQTHRKILESAEAAGYGQLDNSAIIRVIGAPTSKSARFKRAPASGPARLNKTKPSRRVGDRRSTQ